jgi:Mn2+/Fe2+ NRAMP family transporter
MRRAATPRDPVPVSDGAPARALIGRRKWLIRFLAVVGPGLVVMFADTEAGSITTAATSGAQFGYKLILLQLLLIVPLFVVQEMTVRLGVVTGKGHARLIREYYGLGWAWVSLGTMLLTNVAALITEFAGIAGAAQIFGLPPALLVIAAATVLSIVIFTASYKRAEVFALGLCAIELLFVPAAFAAHPSFHTILAQGIIGRQPLRDPTYLLLIASNIGAVIMPWMIFYQQSAVVDKGLQTRDLGYARADTAIGSLVTQGIMCAIIITTAATLYGRHIMISDAAHAALAFEPLVGRFAGVTFGAALIGASILGALVVALATAWAFGEAFQWRCSLNDGGRAVPFVVLYLGCILVAALVVLVPRMPLIAMTVDVEAFNGFVLPIVLGFLLALVNSRRVIGSHRNRLVGNVTTLGLSAVIVVLGVWMALDTLLHAGNL